MLSAHNVLNIPHKGYMEYHRNSFLADREGCFARPLSFVACESPKQLIFPAHWMGISCSLFFALSLLFFPKKLSTAFRALGDP